MTVKIGINPITWSNDDMPSLGGDTPRDLPRRNQAGRLFGTEFGGKFPRTTPGAARVLSDTISNSCRPGTTAASSRRKSRPNTMPSCRT